MAAKPEKGRVGMHIWMMTTEYRPEHGEGIATYFEQASRIYSQKGHKVTIFVADSSLKVAQSISQEGNLRIVRFQTNQEYYYYYMFYVPALSYQYAKVIGQFIEREGKPDCIECQDYGGIAYFLIQRKLTLESIYENINITIVIHRPRLLQAVLEEFSQYENNEFRILEMERFCFRAADGLIFPSASLLQRLSQEVDLTKQNCYIIPHPYQGPYEDGEEKEKKEEKAEKNQSEPVAMLYVGKLQLGQGTLQLLEYLKARWDRGWLFPLIMLGKDSTNYRENRLMSQLIQERYKKYIDQGLLRYEGNVKPQQVHAKLQESLVLLAPFLQAGFSYAVIEALALGQMVLKYQEVNQQENEHNEQDYAFFYHDQDQFHKQLDKIYALTAEERKNYALRGQKRVQQIYHPDRFYQAKQKVWEEILQKAQLSDKATATTVGEKEVKAHFPFIRERPKAKVDPALKTGHKDLLTIIIPYYNMGAYVKETMEELQKVTYQHKEILLINDGSDDLASLQILEEIEETYGPIRRIDQKNQGLVSVRNRGAQEALGEFIAFLDPDDWVAPQYYERAIKILQKYDNVSAVGCWYQIFQDMQGLWTNWNPEPPEILVSNTFNGQSAVYRKSDFLAYGRNDSTLPYALEDYEPTIHLVKQGCGAVVIPEAWFFYRIRKDSMARQFNRSNLSYAFQIIAEKHEPFFQEYALEIFNMLMGDFPNKGPLPSRESAGKER
ncbi:glycosyltransferase [Heliorestis acidaminivorans]|uniref:Glycosyltransferase n=1 Tax=Heliorestis acidaminivorans TaxID=553427 RepID=A0A6I0EY23_9FIRM|nr:glycosyltransferase [Heliorestis acidaminivorans]KAB2951556.1 glycosyltransferase [Heliorestis acidaminivorans]